VSTYSQSELTRVTALSRASAWAVGYRFSGSKNFAVTEHWNGRWWQPVTTPDPGVGSRLLAVAAVSPADIWAVGFRGARVGSWTLTGHWNGNRWTVVPSPSPVPGPDYLNGVVALPARNAWFHQDAERLMSPCGVCVKVSGRDLTMSPALESRAGLAAFSSSTARGLLGDACLRATTLSVAGAGFRRSAPAAVFLPGAGP
jgi:hypothetical protein